MRGHDETNKSLSMGVSIGCSLIAIVKYGKTHYRLYVATPGTNEPPAGVALNVLEVRTLIGILQEIIDEEKTL